jgi:hypothetical protein
MCQLAFPDKGPSAGCLLKEEYTKVFTVLSDLKTPSQEQKRLISALKFARSECIRWAKASLCFAYLQPEIKDLISKFSVLRPTEDLKGYRTYI